MAIPLAGYFDKIRILFLQKTLKNDTLKKIFCNRSLRLLSSFMVVTIFNLFFSLFFPLWVLLIGPIIYGLPHIYSSIRYLHYSLADKNQKTVGVQAFNFLTSIFAGVSIIRLLSEVQIIDGDFLSSSSNTLELLSFIITFLGLAIIYRKSLTKVVFALIFIIPFLLLAWLSPIWIMGVLVLLHNIIAFLYWIVAAKNSSEKKVAYFATLIFIIISTLIFLGVFDSVYKLYTPASALAWADIDYSKLGKMIVPWSANYITWFHSVVAYAFGQSLHYFVWMKAIPDQHHSHQVPTSFRQCYQKLTLDFTKNQLMVIVLSLLVMILVWTFVKLPIARVIYFSLAAYHGYMEMAALALVTIKAEK